MSTIDIVRQPHAPGKKSGISPRHLINIGVFSAIYFVIVFAVGMLGFAGPILMFVSFGISIFINGTVIMLYLVKTPVIGSLTGLSAIVAALFVTMGHPWIMMIIIPTLGLCADLIAYSGKFRSRWRNIVAYAVVTLWYMGPWYPVLTQADKYFADMAAQMGADYADSVRNLVTPTFLLIWAGVVFVLALFSAWVGTKTLEKHFVKAGII